jgi:hypothetical protein
MNVLSRRHLHISLANPNNHRNATGQGGCWREEGINGAHMESLERDAGSLWGQTAAPS